MDGQDGASSESTVCKTVGTTWWNQSFTEQTGTFHVEFAASPSKNNIDAVVGLSNGSASTWTRLAAIVRFNPDGFIDARNGSTYTADQQFRYAAGGTYHIRIEVDVQRRTYSAYVSFSQGEFGTWNQIAANYAFRTEQASVTRLNNLSSFVSTTTGGSLQVCGWVVNTLPPSGSDCVPTTAGGGFVNVATAPGVHGMIVEFDATPSQANMDGVVGISLGKADDYNDLAVGIRFYTNGKIEARDGDRYNWAPGDVSYTAGQKVSFKFLIDLENKKYSAWAYNGTRPPFSVGGNLSFRTQQAGVARLDNVAAIVASSTGRLDLCRPRNPAPPNFHYARGGHPMIAPMVDGSVIVSGLQTGTNQTVKLDTNGKILGSPGFAIGGEPAVDASGNLYLAETFDGSLIVSAYSPSLAFRWSNQIVVGHNARINEVAVAGNRVLVALDRSATPSADNAIIALSTTDGSGGFNGTLGADSWSAVAVGGGGWAYASAHVVDGSPASYSIDAFNPDGSWRFTRNFTGRFSVSAISVAPDGGVVFGGEFFGQTANFGDREMHTIGNSELGPFNSFFVVLAPDGTLRYSAQTASNTLTDIDTNGSLIGIANDMYTQHPWVKFGVYDMAGNVVAGCSECDVGLGEHGYARRIEVADHRVYVNADTHLWWEPERTTKGFMFAYDF